MIDLWNIYFFKASHSCNVIPILKLLKTVPIVKV